MVDICSIIASTIIRKVVLYSHTHTHTLPPTHTHTAPSPPPHTHTLQLYFTQVELLASLFLLLSLSCSLVVLFILKFRLKRAYGVFLILIYVTFLTVAILAEAKVFQIVIPGVITVA